MKTASTVIEYPSELSLLLQGGLFRKPFRGIIRLSDTFQTQDREAFERRLNKNYYACGCADGAKGMLLSLGVGMLYGAYAYFMQDVSFGKAAWRLVGTGLVGACLGKLYGFWKARQDLRHTVQLISERWVDTAKVPVGPLRAI